MSTHSSLNEEAFERHIVESLTKSGQVSPHFEELPNTAYNTELCLVKEELIAFIKDTQQAEYEKLERLQGPGTDDYLVQQVVRELKRNGSLYNFRKGITIQGANFRLYFPKPNSSKNADLERFYQLNRFRVMRQVHFSTKHPEKSVDLVLFLNGIPVITSEVKNVLTGQYVTDAEKQYKNRDSAEPLFAYKRCLVHFALGTEKASMTTRLSGQKTKFFPYNLGIENPPNDDGFATSYIWEDIWQPANIVAYIQHFVHKQIDTEKYYDKDTDSIREKETEKMIFPRYHQLRAVRRILGQLRNDGIGSSYLVKHSAGSGKSNTISWLAHQLSSFYRRYDDDQRMFDCIIVVTDRRVLDKQLQDNILQFEQKRGVVEAIDEKKSAQDLKKAIEDGKSIIITTLQKFPVIAESTRRFNDRNYAVIIDEAHSSQSGDAAKSLRKTLSLSEAAEEDKDEKDLNDVILDEISRTGRQSNLSFFAFTATPKSKTIELFGTRRNDRLEPFDEYTMEQAIKEDFIKDVLQSYTSFRRYYKLAKRPEVTDSEYEKKKTVRLLNSHVDLLDEAIEHKTRIALEHFASETVNEIEGRARAMFITKSRLHAVRFKRKFDDVMREMHLPYKALVAFSGSVYDAEVDETYTESNMNGLRPRLSIPDALKMPQYRILIAANKYQTGFDEPLLHTMFVDKKLGGVSTVQTLSRLNRNTSGKSSTMVLDFVNDPEEIKKDFQDYYAENFMDESNETDPQRLYDYRNAIEDFYLIDKEELTELARIYFLEEDEKHLIQPILAKCKARFNELNDEDKEKFRKLSSDFVRLYRFLSQLIKFKDVELQKWQTFLMLFLREIPRTRESLPTEVTSEVELANYKVQKQYEQSLSLVSEEQEIYNPLGGGLGQKPDEEFELLSEIVKTLNDTFGGIFNEEEVQEIKKLEVDIKDNDDLMKYFNKNNSKANIQDKFNAAVDDMLLEFVNGKIELYNKLTNDKTNSEIKRLWFNNLYDRRVRGIQ